MSAKYYCDVFKLSNKLIQQEAVWQRQWVISRHGCNSMWFPLIPDVWFINAWNHDQIHKTWSLSSALDSLYDTGILLHLPLFLSQHWIKQNAGLYVIRPQRVKGYCQAVRAKLIFPNNIIHTGAVFVLPINSANGFDKLHQICKATRAFYRIKCVIVFSCKRLIYKWLTNTRIFAAQCNTIL